MRYNRWNCTSLFLHIDRSNERWSGHKYQYGCIRMFQHPLGNCGGGMRLVQEFYTTLLTTKWPCGFWNLMKNCHDLYAQILVVSWQSFINLAPGCSLVIHIPVCMIMYSLPRFWSLPYWLSYLTKCIISKICQTFALIWALRSSFDSLLSYFCINQVNGAPMHMKDNEKKPVSDFQMPQYSGFCTVSDYKCNFYLSQNQV